jgi:transcriptional regulator with XRE-family HTH domain
VFDCNSFINRKGWKQRELAERLNVGTSTVGMWCTGKSTPPYDVILKLIDLGISPAELLGEDYSQKFFKNSLDGFNNASDSGVNPIDCKAPAFLEAVKNAILYIEACENSK